MKSRFEQEEIDQAIKLSYHYYQHRLLPVESVDQTATLRELLTDKEIKWLTAGRQIWPLSEKQPEGFLAHRRGTQNTSDKPLQKAWEQARCHERIERAYKYYIKNRSIF